MSSLPGLAGCVLGRHCIHENQVDSTNQYLKDRIDQLPHGAVVLAERQTAGKGRMGRTWTPGSGRELFFSVLLHQIPVVDLPRLPLVAGLSTAQGLRNMSGADCALKWSNDVLLQKQKVCGMLCESKLTTSTATASAMVGIGVNLTQSREDLAQLGLVYATSVFLVTQTIFTPDETAAAILSCFDRQLTVLAKEGFEPIRREYRELCVTLDQEVLITRNGEQETAFAKDIGSDGSLICIGADGMEFAVCAGEASVRGLYGYA